MDERGKKRGKSEERWAQAVQEASTTNNILQSTACHSNYDPRSLLDNICENSLVSKEVAVELRIT